MYGEEYIMDVQSVFIILNEVYIYKFLVVVILHISTMTHIW